MVCKNPFFVFLFCFVLFCFFFVFVFVFFLSKNSKFRVVWTHDFVQISPACGKNIFLRNVWGDFRLPMSALVTLAGKRLNGNFTAKIDFPIGYFMLPLLMLTFAGLKSLHMII